MNRIQMMSLVLLALRTAVSTASIKYTINGKMAFPAYQRNKLSVEEADKIMTAIGVKPGMVIGEVGAGGGRLTVHLARGVGNLGKIYANDIDKNALAVLRARCMKDDINNIEITLGQVDDPLLPKGALDMVVMIKVYHALTQPVALLKNVIPALKPGAPVVIIDYGKNKGAPTSVSTLREDLMQASGEAGFKLVTLLTFIHPEDDIHVFKVKTPQDDLNLLFTELTGMYEMTIGEQNLISLFYPENGKLILGHENNPLSECRPVPDQKLQFEVIPPTGPSYPIEFVRNEDGKIVKCVFRAQGRVIEANRR